MDTKNVVTYVTSPVMELLASMLWLINHEEKTMPEKNSKEIDEWVKETKEKVSDDLMKELHVFFHKESYLGVCLIPFIIRNKLYKDVGAFLTAVQDLPNEELFFYFTHTGYSPGDEIADYNNPAAILPFIEKLNLPESEKWKLTYLILDGDRTKKRLITLVEHFYELHFAKYEQIALSKQGAYIESLKDLSEGYVPEVFEQHGVDPKEEDKIFMFPSYFCDTSILFASDRRDNARLTAFLVGVRHQELLPSSRGEKETLEAIRAMTDERRFQILQLLKRKPLYGYELAQQLGVSNSTVSHHLSSLVSQNFVRAIRQENKIYYEVNRPEVQSVIKQLEVLLIE